MKIKTIATVTAFGTVGVAIAAAAAFAARFIRTRF
jgi:hypothetical protein